MQGFIDSIVCDTFDIRYYVISNYSNKYIVWKQIRNSTKRLKTDLCRSKFDFHQNRQKHKTQMKFSQN